MSWFKNGDRVRIADIEPGTRFKRRGKFFVKVEQSDIACIALDGFWLRYTTDSGRPWRYGIIAGHIGPDGKLKE